MAMTGPSLGGGGKNNGLQMLEMVLRHGMLCIMLLSAPQFLAGLTAGQLACPMLKSDLPLTVYRANVHTGRGEQLVFAGDGYQRDLSCRIENFWGEAQGEMAIKAGQREFSLPMPPVGHYRMRLTDGGRQVAYSEFSIVGKEPPPAARYDSPYGIHPHLSQFWPEESITLLRAAGLSWMRDSIAWAHVEQQKDRLDYTVLPAATISSASSYTNVLAVLAFGSIFHDNNSAPNSPEGFAAWRRYVRETVKHLPKVRRFEVWNEFNSGFFTYDTPTTPENYLKLLRAAHEEIKAVRPDAQVVGGAIVPLPWDWIESLLKLGALQYMDALSVHPYRWGQWQRPPETLAPDMQRLRTLVDQYADGRKIDLVASEVGWPIDPAYGIFPDRQGIYAARTLLVMQRASVALTIIYSFMKPPYDPQQYAVSELSGDNCFLPRAGYQLLNVLARQLTDADYIGDLDAPAPAVAMQFRRQGKPVVALWNPQSRPLALELSTPEEAMAVTDATGSAFTLTPMAGKVILVLGELPVYIEGQVTAICQSSAVSLTAATPVAVADTPLELTLEAPPPLRWQLRGREYSPGRISLMPPAVDEGFNLRGVLSYDGVPNGLVTVGFQTVHRFRNSGITMPELRKLEFHFADRTAGAGLALREINVKLDGKPIACPFQLPMPMPEQEAQKITIPLPAMEDYALRKLEIELVTDGGERIRHQDVIGSNPCFRRDDIVIDGKLDDWGNQPAVDLQRHGTKYNATSQPLAQTGRFYLGWNDQYLLLAAEIHDDLHQAAEPFWSGDSLQFGFSKVMPVDADSTVELKLSFQKSGPTQIGTVEWPLGFNPDLPQRHSKAFCTRTGNRTVYEAAIPWSAVGFLDPADRAFRFSFLSNENNGTMRQGFLMWGGGIGNGKNPLEYVPCTLVDAPTPRETALPE